MAAINKTACPVLRDLVKCQFQSKSGDHEQGRNQEQCLTEVMV